MDTICFASPISIFAPRIPNIPQFAPLPARHLPQHVAKTQRTLQCAQSPPPIASDNDCEDPDAQLAAAITDYLSSPYTPSGGPLSFDTLQRLGRTDLSSAIIANGGYQQVATRLQLDVNLFLPPLRRQPSLSTPVFNTNDDGASLSIGRDLDARLESIEDVMAKKPTQPPAKKKKTPRLKRDVVLSPLEVQQSLENPIPQTYTPPPPPPLGETFTLPTELRLGILTLAALSAAAFGRASPTILDAHTIVVCQAVAKGLAAAHVLLAVYAAIVVAPSLHRSSPLWFIKVLMAGPLAFRFLRALGPLPSTE